MVTRPLRAIASAATLIPVVAIGGPIVLLLLRLNSPVAQSITLWFHRLALKVVGVRVKVVGAPSDDRPLLMASNHASWLDIPVLASIAKISFVAKSEIAEWPVFGTLARMQRSIFVDRSRKTATVAVNKEMAERMISGEPVVLFAEGTSSDGNRVLSFRSSLLGAARAVLAAGGHDTVWVQPVSVAYTHRNGLPMGRLGRPFVAWYGDMAFLTHLWSILRNGAIDAAVTFGEPVRADARTDRKWLAAAMEREVRRLTTNALLGRRPGLAAPASRAETEDEAAPIDAQTAA